MAFFIKSWAPIFSMVMKAQVAASELTPLVLPKVEHSQLVLDQFIQVRCDQLRSAAGHVYAYYTVLTKSSAVVILALTDEGTLILNEEYRHPTQAVLLSCPGGCIDTGEEPLAAAQREFAEETGYTAEKYTVMGSCFPYPGISSQKVYYILATGAKQSDAPQREPTELQRTVLKTRAELKKAILDHQLIDGNMCTALFFYDLHRGNE